MEGERLGKGGKGESNISEKNKKRIVATVVTYNYKDIQVQGICFSTCFSHTLTVAKSA